MGGADSSQRQGVIKSAVQIWVTSVSLHCFGMDSVWQEKAA